jgi:predicted dehydrogenase
MRPGEERARRLAVEFAIPFWTSRVEDVLERMDVDVVDLAVRVQDRLALVEKIAAAGKHILSQKPFALSLADAQRMVDICSDAGVTLMINRRSPAAVRFAYARARPPAGALGTGPPRQPRLARPRRPGAVYSVVHFNRGFQDIPGSWFVMSDNFNLADHGVHFIDLSRYFTGRTPVRVKASTVMVPGQVAVTPMIYSILLDYEPDSGLTSMLHFNNIVRAPHLHRYQWFLDGTAGSLMASHSEVVLALESSTQPVILRLEGKWFPDAFGAAMGEMLLAVAEHRDPLTSGWDNLDTLRIVDAAIESSTVGRTIELAPGNNRAA